ncbi:hypothetical protein RB601_005488 [Gaeumannomyces tritici]
MASWTPSIVLDTGDGIESGENQNQFTMPCSKTDGCKAACYRQLLVASRWLVVLSTCLFLAVISAGTFLVPHQLTKTLALKSLAIISYDGIIPVDRNQTHLQDGSGRDFTFTMHSFSNAFSWECELCPQSAGVVELGPNSGSDPRALMLQIADAAVPRSRDAPSFSECFGRRRRSSSSSSRNEPLAPGCPDPTFFDAWLDPPGLGPYPQPRPVTKYVAYIGTVLVAALTLACEVLMARWPRLMRCRCLVLARWCPYPKEAPAELEALPPHRWDRVRALSYPFLSAYFSLALLYDGVIPRFLLGHLRSVDRRLPGDLSMRPRQNVLHLWLLGTCIAMSALASVLVFVRYRMSRPKGYVVLEDPEDIKKS